MKRITLLIALTVLVSYVIAHPVEIEANYGWKMLTIPSVPSVAGMAGTGSFVSCDAASFIQQPTAGLVGNINSVSGSQQNWIFGTKLNTLAINKSSYVNSFGFALKVLDYGDMKARDITGEIIGEFHPLDLNLVFNYAQRITPNIYTGINLLLLYQKIESHSSTGIAFDYGLTYFTPKQGLDFHFALKHFGVTTKVNHERIKLPYTPEISLSYDFPNHIHDLYIETVLLKHPDDSNLKARIGSRINLNQMLSIRFGYLVNYDKQDITAGLGLEWRRMSFDYAYLPFKDDIDDAHSFGISYRF